MINNKTVLSCFPVADEMDVVEIHLAELYNTVDAFCIVESCFDQCGNPKPYNFELNKDKFTPFLDKVFYHKIEDKAELRYSFDWRNEIYVRQSLGQAILKYQKDKNIKLDGNELVVFGDADEVVSSVALKEAIELNKEILSFNHLFGFAKLNLIAAQRNWFGAILTNLSNIISYGFEYWRKQKDQLEHYENKNYPCYHFSGVGEDSFKTAWHKQKTRIEPREKIPEELKEQYRELFNKCVFEDKYFFYSDFPGRRDEDLKLSILDKSKLPSYVIQNWDRFSKLCLDYPETKEETKQLNLI